MASGGSFSSVPEAEIGHLKTDITKTQLRRLQRLHSMRCRSVVAGHSQHHLHAHRCAQKAVPALAEQIKYGVHSLKEVEQQPDKYAADRCLIRKLRLQRNAALHPSISPQNVTDGEPGATELPPPPPPPIGASWTDPAIIMAAKSLDVLNDIQQSLEPAGASRLKFMFNKDAPAFVPNCIESNCGNLADSSVSGGSDSERFDWAEDYDYDVCSQAGHILCDTCDLAETAEQYAHFTEKLEDHIVDELIHSFGAEVLFNADRPNSDMLECIKASSAASPHAGCVQIDQCSMVLNLLAPDFIDSPALDQVDGEVEASDGADDLSFSGDELAVIEAFLAGHVVQTEYAFLAEQDMPEDDIDTASYEADYFGDSRSMLPTSRPAFAIYLWVVLYVGYLGLLRFVHIVCTVLGLLWHSFLQSRAEAYMIGGLQALSDASSATWHTDEKCAQDRTNEGLVHAAAAESSVANGALRKRRRKKQLPPPTAYESGDDDPNKFRVEDVFEHGCIAAANDEKQRRETADAVAPPGGPDDDVPDVHDNDEPFVMQRLTLRKAQQHRAKIQKRHFVDQMAPHIERLTAMTANERLTSLKKSAGFITCGVLEGDSVLCVEYLLKHFDMLHLLE